MRALSLVSDTTQAYVPDFLTTQHCMNAFERASTMTATNHDDQLGEIYPTMLNEFNCTFGVSFSRFHCCGRHVHVAVMV